jgi:hypothetical protein
MDDLTPTGGPGDGDEWPRFEPPDWASGLDDPPVPDDDDLDQDDEDEDEALSGAPVVPLHGASDLEDDPDDDLLDDNLDGGGGAHLPLDASNMQFFEYQDLVDWGHWLIARWQLQERFPRCWPAHHSLRSEVLALRRDWALAEQGKVALSLWLHNLDLALGRIERLWKASCADNEHWPDEQPPSGDAWAKATAEALFGPNSKPTDEVRSDVRLGCAVPFVPRPAPGDV